MNAEITAVNDSMPCASNALACGRGLTGATPQDALAQPQLLAEWGDIGARTARLDAEIPRRQAEFATAREVVTKLQTTLPMAHQREADFKALTEQGFVAGHAGQDRTCERIEIECGLATQVRSAFPPARAWRPAVVARSAPI